MTPEADFFAITEGSTRPGGTLDSRDRTRAQVGSLLAHLFVLASLIALSTASWLSFDAIETPPPGEVHIVFHIPGEGPGGGGGGGGYEGERPTAATGATGATGNEPVLVSEEPRRAPIAPRKPRPLSFDDLDVPDLPQQTRLLFEGAFSPDAVEFPGLSLADARDHGGLDTVPSSGTGGGTGGGTGTGVGEGEGWGVGPGRGGGFGGGDFAPGGFDVEPILVYEPPSPPYPPVAREKMVAGEVILQVLVKLDGSTEVVRVIKSLPYCVDAAKEHARLWRW